MYTIHDPVVGTITIEPIPVSEADFLCHSCLASSDPEWGGTPLNKIEGRSLLMDFDYVMLCDRCVEKGI